MREEVKKVIEEVRPTIQADGGDIELVDVDEKKGIVKVRLQGACIGCPMSALTLQEGIGRVLKNKVKGVKELQAVYPMDKAYFDHSATTPVDPAVKKAMEPFFGEIFGNASSIHLFGQQAVTAVDNARETIADFLGCKTNEIIFTSGATESDNIVIQGLTKPGEHI